ncbi:Phosphopentomutase, partial [Frankliniella fusca]
RQQSVVGRARHEASLPLPPVPRCSDGLQNETSNMSPGSPRAGVLGAAVVFGVLVLRPGVIPSPPSPSAGRSRAQLVVRQLLYFPDFRRVLSLARRRDSVGWGSRHRQHHEARRRRRAGVRIGAGGDGDGGGDEQAHQQPRADEHGGEPRHQQHHPAQPRVLARPEPAAAETSCTANVSRVVITLNGTGQFCPE